MEAMIEKIRYPVNIMCDIKIQKYSNKEPLEKI